MSSLILQLSLILTPIVVGCSPANSSYRPRDAGQTLEAARTVRGMDGKLIRQVREFARDEGPPGKRAWEELNAYPRQELIDSLLRLRGATPEGDPLRTDIAFVLCNFDHDYQANRSAITTAFAKTSPHVFGEERLIIRLVARGDTDLLPVLFSAAGWSDGALSAGLSETFAEQLRSDPERFLLKLKDEPSGTRREVYEVLSGTRLPENDVAEIRKYLKSVREDAAVAPVAREMLATLAARRQD